MPFLGYNDLKRSYHCDLKYWEGSKIGSVIVIASGKGGTGKTTVTGAVASALAILGNKTLCVDCDIGLKNLDLALGLSDSAMMDFFDVLDGSTPLEEAVTAHPDIENLYFLSAPSLRSPEDADRAAMLSMTEKMRESFDYCLIDAPAGIGAGFRLAAEGADRAIVVATGDAASLRDGQRTVMEFKKLGIEDVRLLINRLSPRMLRRARATVDDIIDTVGAQLIGLVSEDESVPLSVNLGKPLMLFGARYAFDQFINIAKRITGEKIPLGRV